MNCYQKIVAALVLFLTGISSAWADTAATAAHKTAGGSLLSTLPIMLLIVVAFYFLFIRPQSKRAKQQKKMLEEVQVGDEVVTIGGIVGRLSERKDDFVVLTIADGIKITMQKNAISSVLPKGTLDAKA